MKVSKGAGVINTQPAIHAITVGEMGLELGFMHVFACVCVCVCVC